MAVPRDDSRPPRRRRHGRSLRVTAGAFPGALVPRERLAAEVDAATERLQARNRSLPAFTVELRDLPPPEVVAAAGPEDVASGHLLGTVDAAGAPQSTAMVVVLYARPLLLWADDAGALRTLVRQTLVAQLAEATGLDPDELDPDAR